MPHKKKLLVVDDDAMLLDVLEGILGELRNEWDMQFFTKGEEALEALTRWPVDLVLADIHLAGMGGIHFLSDIKNRYPHTIRIACSGCAHPNTIVQSLEVAHQYLPKPLTLAALKATLSRAHELQDRLSNAALQQLVSNIQALPSIPTIYRELEDAMQSPHASINTAAGIIAKDMAMLSKILQVVNSAYFGLRRTISSPAHALSLLGLDRVKGLVLTVKLFEQCTQTGPLPVSLEQLWKHGLATAVSARAIAQLEGAGSLAVEHAFMAGLLHDIGLLVLNTNCPDRYWEVFRLIKEDGRQSPIAEREVFGATHADVGAYLLGIWGLHEVIVEAVAFHHEPKPNQQNHGGVPAAVHVANALDEERDPAVTGGTATEISAEYVATRDSEGRIQAWREIYRHAVSSDTNPAAESSFPSARR
ncbi:MAG TPA: response regulator [Nitrospiraceae bacterium]|nr:response regulator [Nitrospiraceae bacterium]